MLHACSTDIPFGGVGESGHGKYRGRDTFESFIHRRPVLDQPLWIEGQLKVCFIYEALEPVTNAMPFRVGALPTIYSREVQDVQQNDR